MFLPPKAGAVHDRPLLREPPGPQLIVQLFRNFWENIEIYNPYLFLQHLVNDMKLSTWLFSPTPLPPAQPRPINWEKRIWGTDDFCVDRKYFVILTLISETSGSRAFLMICSWNKRHSLAHSFSRQLFVCKLSPLHPVPFAPLLHFLFLFVWPGPHFALHVLHADHLVQAEQEEFELEGNKALNSSTIKDYNILNLDNLTCCTPQFVIPRQRKLQLQSRHVPWDKTNIKKTEQTIKSKHQ